MKPLSPHTLSSASAWRDNLYKSLAKAISYENLFQPQKQNVDKFRGQRILVTFHGTRLTNGVVVNISNEKYLLAIVDERIVPQVFYHLGYVFHAIGI